jgi:CRISPR/Cas system-associated exonuclease Cas4 (RecB family)
MQLMVYLRLLRASYGPRASAVGLIRYRDRSFEVRLTPKREAELVRIIEAIRAIRAGRLVGHRGHEVPAKCRGCAMYDRCDERLVSPIRE